MNCQRLYFHFGFWQNLLNSLPFSPRYRQERLAQNILASETHAEILTRTTIVAGIANRLLKTVKALSESPTLCVNDQCRQCHTRLVFYAEKISVEATRLQQYTSDNKKG